MSAVCRDDDKLRVSWKVAEWYRQGFSSRQFAVEVDGVHVRDEAASGLENQAYDWDGAAVGQRHKVRVQARTLSGLTSAADYPWTPRVTAKECPRFKPQDVSVSCNSHGVVTLSWDHASGATQYRTGGITCTGGTGDRRMVHAQRNEGASHGPFTVEAEYGRGKWSEPANAPAVNCDPLSPSTPGHPDWQSPNGERETGCVQSGCVNKWVNPPLARLVASEATMNLGSSNCTAAKPKTGGGHTRTCTFIWTEPRNIDLTDDIVELFHHSKTFPHDEDDQVWHIYKNDQGHAETTRHRHCATHDVNGDGDTDDPVDNDGTCPGPDTSLPDLPWHPKLPNASDPFWKSAIRNGAITGVPGAVAPSVGTAAMARLGLIAGGSAGGPVGAVVGLVVGIGVGVLYGWLKDDKPTVTIAGHTGCLDPPVEVDWQTDRWAQEEHSFTKTEQAHGYETVYEHIIYSCKKKASSS